MMQGQSVGNRRTAAKSFVDLVAWQRAHAFVLSVYRFTQSMPKEETYGLSLQMRRAAVSIAANIAEGFRKHSNRDKIRYLNISQGSLEESRYYLILANDLGYGRTHDKMALLDETGRVLHAYLQSIRKADA